MRLPWAHAQRHAEADPRRRRSGPLEPRATRRRRSTPWLRRMSQADHPVLVPEQGEPAARRSSVEAPASWPTLARSSRRRRGGLGPDRGGGSLGVPARCPSARAFGSRPRGSPSGAAGGHPVHRRDRAPCPSGLGLLEGRNGCRSHPPPRSPPAPPGDLLDGDRHGHRGRGPPGGGRRADGPVARATPVRRARAPTLRPAAPPRTPQRRRPELASNPDAATAPARQALGGGGRRRCGVLGV